MAREELITAVRRLRKKLADRPFKERNVRLVSAVDRNGKEYTRDEMVQIFVRLYPESPKAIRLMFPSISAESIMSRARNYGISRKNRCFSEQDDEVIRKYHPDYKRIAAELERAVIEVKHRSYHIGLCGPTTVDRVWTPEEDNLLRKGLLVPGRNARSKERRRKRLGINYAFAKAVGAMSIADLRKLVEAHVAKNYSDQYRLEAVSDVIDLCLQGKCGIKPEQLIAAGKKAVAAVYKIHPDRGAPISMDAKLFDDGEATVGDRISSDAFHF